MKISTQAILFFTFLSVNIFAQKNELFSIQQMEYMPSEKVYFVSLSEFYPLSDHPDSSAIPDISEWEMTDANTIILDSIYRERFLSRITIAPIGNLIIFDYVNGISATFPVNTLRVIACLNIYAGSEDWPYSQYEYMIGFELQAASLANFNNFFERSFVYIGIDDPFLHEPLKPIVWEHEHKSNFPKNSLTKDQKKMIQNHSKDQLYSFEDSGYRYMIQDYLFDGNLNARHLVIQDSRSKKIVCNRMFMNSEGSMIAPVTLTQPDSTIQVYQWTGELLIGKPPIVFGFMFEAFSCPNFIFLNPDLEDMYIRCDNRH